MSTFLLTALAQPSWSQPCRLDCNGNGEVESTEVAAGIEIALLRQTPQSCNGAGDEVAVDLIVAAVVSRLTVCGSSAPTATPTPTATAAPTPTSTPISEQIPPTNSQALLAWLRDGRYLGWHAESAVHASAGPHFGRVRTFLNDAVFSSLAEENGQHPAGSALVKELYGSSGNVVRGWSVMVKTQDDSAGGQGWYWYERFDNSTFAAGNGIGGCFGCHASNYNGLTSRDHVLTPFPLQ